MRSTAKENYFLEVVDNYNGKENNGAKDAAPKNKLLQGVSEIQFTPVCSIIHFDN